MLWDDLAEAGQGGTLGHEDLNRPLQLIVVQVAQHQSGHLFWQKYITHT